MTDEELRAIRERAEKATPGPWEWSDGTCDDEDGERHGYRCGPMWVDVCDQLAVPVVDAEFIVHAREDVAALLAEVERLRADRGEMHPCFICGTPTAWMWLRADGRALSTDPEVLDQLARERYRCPECSRAARQRS